MVNPVIKGRNRRVTRCNMNSVSRNADHHWTFLFTLPLPRTEDVRSRAHTDEQSFQLSIVIKLRRHRSRPQSRRHVSHPYHSLFETRALMVRWLHSKQFYSTSPEQRQLLRRSWVGPDYMPAMRNLRKWSGSLRTSVILDVEKGLTP